MEKLEKKNLFGNKQFASCQYPRHKGEKPIVLYRADILKNLGKEGKAIVAHELRQAVIADLFLPSKIDEGLKLILTEMSAGLPNAIKRYKDHKTSVNCIERILQLKTLRQLFSLDKNQLIKYSRDFL